MSKHIGFKFSSTAAPSDDDETEIDASRLPLVRDATETDLELNTLRLMLGTDLGVARPSEVEAGAHSLCDTSAALAVAAADRGVAACLTDACSLASDSAEGMRSSCGLPSGTWIVRISGVALSISMLMEGDRGVRGDCCMEGNCGEGDRGVNGGESDDAVELAASVNSRTAEGIVVVALGGGSRPGVVGSVSLYTKNLSAVAAIQMALQRTSHSRRVFQWLSVGCRAGRQTMAPTPLRRQLRIADFSRSILGDSYRESKRT